jgi:predicted acyl esterase
VRVVDDGGEHLAGAVEAPRLLDEAFLAAEVGPVGFDLKGFAQDPQRRVVGVKRAGALDPDRSKPWKPWHKLTRDARQKVVPGEINEYAIEILSSANLFKAGHRICVDICAMDVPTGVGGATNVEYISYHLCSSKTVLHKIYHDERHPSHLVLPVIPQD